MSLPPFNPLVPQFRSDPYPFYRRYREEDPVHWNGLPTRPGQGAWYLFRSDDVVAALKHASLGKTSKAMAPEPLGGLLGQWMLLRNPPDHTRLRALVSRAFTPQVVDRLEPAIQATADFLLDEVQGAGHMDAILHYASALPLIVIAELLGIPARDRGQFRKWSIDLAVVLDLSGTREGVLNASRAALELTEYLRHIVSERRSAPRDDLISALIAAEEDHEKLTENELLAMCVLLLGAGHETTVNLIGNGILALLQNPVQLAALRDDPSIAEGAIEELLRYDSSVQMVFREALADLEIGGKSIRRGETVVVLLGSANRDPAVFVEPDRLDLTRARTRHTAFGLGIHFCLGAPLARLEAQIAFDTLLRRMPALTLGAGPLHWSDGIVFHGVEALPVTF
jgi:pimeloyl-[acyl-carrier protein] synthase